MNHANTNKYPIDYLKKYHLFSSMLFLWILFIPLKNTFYQVSVICLILMFVYHLVVFKTYNSIFIPLLKHLRGLFVSFGVILLSMLISSLVGIDTLNNLGDVLKFFYRYIAIIFIVLYFYSQHFFDKKFLITIVCLSLSIQALDGMYQYFMHYDLLLNRGLESGGLTGATFSRNIFGFMMAIYTSLLFYLLVNYQPNKHPIIQKSILFIFFLISLFVLLHSFSRASWVSFAVFLLLYCITYMRKNLFSKKNLFIFISVGLVIFVIFSTNPLLMNRLHELLQGSDANRFTLWRHAIGFIKEHLWFGYGVNSSLELFKNLAAGRVHNMFLEITLYLGLLGLFGYILLFAHIYKTIYSIRKFEYAIFVTSFLVLLQFDGSLVNSKIHLSFFIIYIVLIYTYLIDRTLIDESCKITHE